MYLPFKLTTLVSTMQDIGEGSYPDYIDLKKRLPTDWQVRENLQNNIHGIRINASDVG